MTLISSGVALDVAPHAGAWIETRGGAGTSRNGRSHPTRVRGLKPGSSRTTRSSLLVAPHAGAWIETPAPAFALPGSAAVAPHAGAWIETVGAGFSGRTVTASHPTRVRGLKRPVGLTGNGVAFVAPHAGAWIETASHGRSMFAAHVAPHAGAWIETWPICAWASRRRVAPHAGAWIETPLTTRRQL